MFSVIILLVILLVLLSCSLEKVGENTSIIMLILLGSMIFSVSEKKYIYKIKELK